MERINPLLSGNIKDNWQTSASINGTFKAQNSGGIVEAEKTIKNVAGDSSAPLESGSAPSIKENQKNLSGGSVFSAILISLFSGVLVLFLKKSLA